MFSLLKIVGVFELTQSNYWVKSYWDPSNLYFFTNENSHMKMLKSNPTYYSYINEYCLDYSKIRYSKIPNILATCETLKTSTKALNETYVATISDIVSVARQKMDTNTSILIIIFLPLMFMLVTYILMISNIIAKNDSNEISQLKSRGTKLKDICIPYIIQGLFMGLISIIISPKLAKLTTTMMDLSSNFLEFNNSNGLDVYTS